MTAPVPFLEVPVEHVMTPRPATVGPEDPLGDAAGLMVQGGFRHLPVVDVDGRLVGMLSERDLRERLGTELERFADAALDLLSADVEGSMRTDPITISSAQTVRDALELLMDERVGALPVVDDERLVGILSYLDVLGYLRHESPPGASARDVRAPSPKRREAAKARKRPQVAQAKRPRAAKARKRPQAAKARKVARAPTRRGRRTRR
jgi:CBS domain-containing protein